MNHEDGFRQPFGGVLPQDQGEDNALKDSPDQGDIPGDLGNLAPSGLTLIFLEILQLGQGCGEQLDDDRGVDEGQDPQGKDAQGGQPPAGEDVQKADELPPLGEEVGKGHPVDSRHGDVDPEPHDQEQGQGGEHPVAQAFGLNQLAEDFPGTGVATPAKQHGELGGRAWKARKKAVC